MRHKRFKNRGGTASEKTADLATQRRPATRIHRKKWHAHKRRQMLMVWKNNDADNLILLGAVNRQRIADARGYRERI